MSRRRLELEKLTVKFPQLFEVEFKNRMVKDVPVHIFSKSSGRCIDVQGYSEDEGGSIIQYSVHGENNQRWVFKPVGNGFYHIISVHSNKCLDVSEPGEDGFAYVVQKHPDGGRDSQKWWLKPVENGYYQIINRQRSDNGLDVLHESQENAAKIIAHPIHGGDNQKWRLLIAEPL
jgi:hypothetical protein